MKDRRNKQSGNEASQTSWGCSEPPENDFLFSFPSLNQRMQLLQRLVSDGEFLTLVVGEHASGKSMLLRNFLFHNSAKWQACRIRIRPKGRTHNPTILKHLQKLSAFRLDNKRQYVLILDDAHHLSLAALQLLIRFARKSESSHTCFSIVLLGEPQFKPMVDRLADEIPPTTAITTLYMPALDEEETKAYLRQRLLTNEHFGPFGLSDKQVRNIYLASGGLPGRIDQEIKMLFNGARDNDA